MWWWWYWWWWWYKQETGERGAGGGGGAKATQPDYWACLGCTFSALVPARIIVWARQGGAGGAQGGKGDAFQHPPIHHTADTVTTSGLRGLWRRLLAKKARVAKLADSSSLSCICVVM